jgi:queuine tRNA-ribosyltransferase
MGVGTPRDLISAIGAGIDMFDCVLPTRLARHGTVLTSTGRLSLRSAACRDDAGPLDPSCSCPVCTRWSRAYLRHLQMVGEPAAGRLVTIHNVSWILGLVERLRAAVAGGTLATLRADLADVWCQGEKGPR